MGQISTQVVVRGRRLKFTPERVQQIKNLVEGGKSREEIAELIGVTVGSLQVTCSRLGISLRRPASNTRTSSLRRDAPRSNGGSTPSPSRGGNGALLQLSKERPEQNSRSGPVEQPQAPTPWQEWAKRATDTGAATPPKGSVTLHTSDEAEPGIDADANYQLLIYITGGASNADRDNLERIKALRALAPDVPLMILSDSETREEIISTLNVSAQGFLYVGANAELAAHVFSFILNRGRFPSAILPKQTYPSQRHPAIDCIPTPSCVMGGGNGAAKDLEDAGPRNRSLTARQKAVLELLSRGETNKVIARRLGMREGTVKVHVRQIMRKFGVTNRTRVAVVCANGRPSQKAATLAEF
jgi:DNA-binding NarL/FixJ family response regulator